MLRVKNGHPVELGDGEGTLLQAQMVGLTHSNLAYVEATAAAEKVTFSCSKHFTHSSALTQHGARSRGWAPSGPSQSPQVLCHPPDQTGLSRSSSSSAHGLCSPC